MSELHPGMTVMLSSAGMKGNDYTSRKAVLNELNGAVARVTLSQCGSKIRVPAGWLKPVYRVGPPSVKTHIKINNIRKTP